MTQELRFPIFLSIFTLLATAGALLLAVYGIHWGALARSEVLNLSCGYVLSALAAVGFIVWPAVRIDRTYKAMQLQLDLCAIIVSAAPALMVAWWVSEYSWSQASGSLLTIFALLAAIAALLGSATLAALSARVLVQSGLLLWYLGSLFCMYFQAEFIPADASWMFLLMPIGMLIRPIPLATALLPVILLASVAVLLDVATFVITQRLEKRARILADANRPVSTPAK